MISLKIKKKERSGRDKGRRERTCRKKFPIEGFLSTERRGVPQLLCLYRCRNCWEGGRVKRRRKRAKEKELKEVKKTLTQEFVHVLNKISTSNEGIFFRIP